MWSCHSMLNWISIILIVRYFLSHDIQPNFSRPFYPHLHANCFAQFLPCKQFFVLHFKCMPRGEVIGLKVGGGGPESHSDQIRMVMDWKILLLRSWFWHLAQHLVYAWERVWGTVRLFKKLVQFSTGCSACGVLEAWQERYYFKGFKVVQILDVRWIWMGAKICIINWRVYRTWVIVKFWSVLIYNWVMLD